MLKGKCRSTRLGWNTWKTITMMVLVLWFFISKTDWELGNSQLSFIDSSILICAFFFFSPLLRLNCSFHKKTWPQMNIVDSNSNFRCLHIKCGESLALEPNVMTYFSLLYALKKSLAPITFKLWKYVRLHQILRHFADHLLKYLRSFEIPWESRTFSWKV